MAESVCNPHSLNWNVRVQATCHNNSKSRMNTMFAKSWLRQRAFNRSSFQPTFVFQDICMPSIYLRPEFYCTIAKKNRNLRISYMASRLSMNDTVTKDEFFCSMQGFTEGEFCDVHEMKFPTLINWRWEAASLCASGCCENHQALCLRLYSRLVITYGSIQVWIS